MREEIEFLDEIRKRVDYILGLTLNSPDRKAWLELEAVHAFVLVRITELKKQKQEGVKV